MSHKLQLENKRYRNWVKAGLGIKYVKDGLEPFCDYLVNQQHADILSKVKKKHNLAVVSCRLCDIRTLQPDHVRTRSKQCPLGQINCNCQHPFRKIACPNSVCGAIYDEIIKLHASTPPAPSWRNTDAQQWCTEPWSVAKCFINAPGYEQKMKAAEFDCPGLLHVLINNFKFQQHIKCLITGTNVFSRVRNSRNEIFHSNTMELEDTKVNSYIDDMIELLEDETEIKQRQESKDAVKNLLELKQEDFIISTTDEAEIRRVVMAAINEKESELKQTIGDLGNEGKQELVEKGLDIKSELEQTGQKIRKDLVTIAAEGKHNISAECLIMKWELGQIGRKFKTELVLKDDEIRATAAEVKCKIEEKGLVIKNDLEQTAQKIKKEFVTTAAVGKHDIDVKDLMRWELELEKRLKKTEKEIGRILEQKPEVLKNKKNNAGTKEEAENNGKKAEFQKKLVKLYTKYARSVPSLPLQPKRQQMDVSDIYVLPLMTLNIQDTLSRQWKEVVISMQEIFEDTETPAKLIYVLGEAGAGKSMFCKILVHFWCIAYSYPECSLDESDIVKKMGNFKFLFYVLLRNCSDCDSIEKMLEKSYDDPALRDILQNEPSKCLIVLDGLDEWTPEKKHNSKFLTPGLPGRDLDADYTIITTSRQWKFDALSITDSEVDMKIKLRGIDQNGIEDLTEKTVERLNDIFCKNKNARNCKIDLQSRPVSEISHIPLILQQLIMLWFDDKLRENSMFAIYSSMLALFLEWKALKSSKKSSKHQERDMITQECLIYQQLPDYLCLNDAFRKNTRVIQYLSHLAYETLFDKNKETTLTFSKSTLTRLNIPNDEIKSFFNVGILTEERNVSLLASIRQQESVSFFHKSIQEYLAAVYVASQFKEMVISQKLLQRNKRKHTDVCKMCVLKYFSSCETVVDILERSNVFIMLCGLEPRLLTNVSEYIYNVAIGDKLVVEERNTVPELFLSKHNKLIRDVQACIFKCIEEVMSVEKNVHSPVYIADLYVSDSKHLARYGKTIVLKHVLSVEVDERCGMTERHKDAFYHLLESLTKCDQLKVIKVNGIHSDNSAERNINAVTKILEANVSSLETTSLLKMGTNIISILVPILLKMRRLVSLQLARVDFVPREVCLSLSKVLSQTTRFQHITLDISCEPYGQHMIALSKHKQLRHVDITYSTFCMVSCNTENLETCKLSVSSGDMMDQLCGILYKACKLNHIQLYGISSIRFSLIEARQVTENLIILLPSLVSLSTLTLWVFTFTDNIIACPCDMKNLKVIELNSVTMTMATWYRFIDSLHALPQSVQVKVYDMCIADETIAGISRRDKKQEANARHYVRRKKNYSA